MAEPEDIIARVGISGEDDVISSLGKISAAGVEAFARLESAATGGSETFAAIAAVIVGVGAAIGALAEHGAKATQAIGDLAQSTGASVEDVSAMQLALTSVGGSSENLARSMARLASEVTRTWDEIQKAVQDRANVINASQLKVQETSLGVIAAQQKLREDALRIGGGPLPGAAAAPRSPFQQQQDQRAEAENKFKEAALARSEAIHAADEVQRNDINNVIEAIGKVIAGEETLAQTATKINPTLDNVFKGIVGNSGDAAVAIKDFTGDYLQLATASPKVLEVLAKSADFFKHSGDDALNAALGVKELGRGSGTLVSALQNLGSQGLDKLTERFKSLGFETKTADVALARDFNTTLFSLQNELGALKEQISSAFQGDITSGLKTFKSTIEDNRQAIVDFAKQIADDVKPAILDFFDVISGKQATRTQWIGPIAEAIKSIGRAAVESAKFVGELIAKIDQFNKSDTAVAIATVLNKLAGIKTEPEGAAPTPAPSPAPTPPNSKTVSTTGATTAPPGSKTLPDAGILEPPGSKTAPSVGTVPAPLPAAAPSSTTAASGVTDAFGRPIPVARGTGIEPLSFGPNPTGPAATALPSPTPTTPVPVVITGTTGGAGAATSETFTGTAPVKNIIGGTGESTGLLAFIDKLTDLLIRIGAPQPNEPGTGGADTSQATQQVTTSADQLNGAIGQVTSGLTSLAVSLAAFVAPGAAQGKAEGGVVSGPGGPKDDKVPIMASAGEYVVTADGSNLHEAISHFGGQGQQSFAQRTGITTDLGHVKDLVHYALGGLVQAFQAPLAHYATGGPVRASAASSVGGRPINLHIGGETITGLTATESAARSISRIAVERGVRSGGTKASWYRGS